VDPTAERAQREIGHSGPPASGETSTET
jgi:hypothetical protein